MNKQEIITSIKAEKLYLQEHFGVEEIALFGSYARGEENKDSDLDILVKMRKKTLRNYIGIIDYLQDKLKVKVDLVTKHDHLSERFLRLITKDIIYV
ncbi:MAG: nucleotidyltransferase family protein [Bacteroidia bacterium]